ncbi:uncharacterized protein N7483_007361 [Penicillium malachiteum]|uniref:uncharacterized protein n=1 Tax=Penicillium malachiteum TaxID=1324776 RepID=UPI0025468F08|nr:uncharacterized protein N7483_007361 [Penicillium malachiteum]KAJ5726004.1 hypothetical protein N7483_007361 [Penicillium malachiteum]
MAFFQLPHPVQHSQGLMSATESASAEAVDAREAPGRMKSSISHIPYSSLIAEYIPSIAFAAGTKGGKKETETPMRVRAYHTGMIASTKGSELEVHFSLRAMNGVHFDHLRQNNKSRDDGSRIEAKEVSC